jgi:hypothetical protein
MCAPVHVLMRLYPIDKSLVCLQKRRYKIPSSNQNILPYLYFYFYQSRNNSWKFSWYIYVSQAKTYCVCSVSYYSYYYSSSSFFLPPKVFRLLFFGLSRSTRCGCCSLQVSSISDYDQFCVFQFFSILTVSMATAATVKIPKVFCTSIHSA